MGPIQNYNYPRPTTAAAANAILAPSAEYNNNYYYDHGTVGDEATPKADVIVGKPIPQSSGGTSGGITYDEEDNGITIIGDSCFYSTKYSSPAPGAFMYNVHHRIPTPTPSKFETTEKPTTE